MSSVNVSLENNLVVVSTPGPQGAKGPSGEGVPDGGDAGQLLHKLSGADGDADWTGVPTVDRLGLNTGADETVGAGELAWDADEGTVCLGQNGGFAVRLIRDGGFLCRNGAGATIQKGRAVMFAGTIGASGRIVVAPMIADGSLPGYVFLGIAAHDIPAGQDGYVLTIGKVSGVNTTAWAEGDILWCDPAVPGGLINVEPVAPNLKLSVAAALNSKNNGTLVVRWDTGRRLADLHDVEANGARNDLDVLGWSESAGRWEPTDRLTLLEQRVTALENA